MSPPAGTCVQVTSSDSGAVTAAPSLSSTVTTEGTNGRGPRRATVRPADMEGVTLGFHLCWSLTQMSGQPPRIPRPPQPPTASRTAFTPVTARTHGVPGQVRAPAALWCLKMLMRSRRAARGGSPSYPRHPPRLVLPAIASVCAIFASRTLPAHCARWTTRHAPNWDRARLTRDLCPSLQPAWVRPRSFYENHCEYVFVRHSSPGLSLGPCVARGSSFSRLDAMFVPITMTFPRVPSQGGTLPPQSQRAADVHPVDVEYVFSMDVGDVYGDIALPPAAVASVTSPTALLPARGSARRAPGEGRASWSRRGE